MAVVMVPSVVYISNQYHSISTTMQMCQTIHCSYRQLFMISCLNCLRKLYKCLICQKYETSLPDLYRSRGGRVMRWCWVSFQCQGVLHIWSRVGKGPTALAVGAGGGCLDIFSLVYHFSFLSPSLWEMALYRLKYCLKGPLSPKQPTNQII